MSSAEITAQDVKALRERTGAGMMDCKKALRGRGISSRRSRSCACAKARKSRTSVSEWLRGTVQAYVHAGAKVES